MVKQRKDSIAIFEKEGREDLAVVEREEVAIIEKYLPAQLSPEELKQAVQNLIEELGATSMKEMGKVIGLAKRVEKQSKKYKRKIRWIKKRI